MIVVRRRDSAPLQITPPLYKADLVFRFLFLKEGKEKFILRSSHFSRYGSLLRMSLSTVLVISNDDCGFFQALTVPPALPL
jgi:hypothetical protein